MIDNRSVWRFGLVAALASSLPVPAAADSLEVAFWKRAPEILEHCRAGDWGCVGVLKFHVRSADGSLTHTAGALNYNAARRLESALVLANIRASAARKPQQPVMIVRDASKTAGAIRSADHLKAYGRRPLLDGYYMPSWGEDKAVKVDALVTGILTLDRRLGKLDVQLYCFDQKNINLRPLLEPFSVDLNTDTLVESGHTFRRFELGAFEKLQNKQLAGEVVPLKPPAAPPTSPPEVAVFADVLKDAPIRLEMLYDGQPVPLVFKDGIYQSPTPATEQQVSFRLTPVANDAKYGVVLMINGMSTLNMERKPPSQCQRWVFAPGAAPATIAGFYQQLGNRTEFAPFRIVAPAQELRTEYKDKLGLITFSIFKEQLTPPATPGPLKEVVAAREMTQRVVQGADPPTTVVATAGGDDEHPPDLPRSLQAFRDRFASQTGSAVRNVIVPAQGVAAADLQSLTFQNPVQVLSATIRYFEPRE